MHRRALAALTILLAAGALPAARAEPPARMSNGMLVNTSGMTLYTFDRDTAGSGKSACNGPCAGCGRRRRGRCKARGRSHDRRATTAPSSGPTRASRSTPSARTSKAGDDDRRQLQRCLARRSSDRPPARQVTRSSSCARRVTMGAPDEAEIVACIPSLRRYARGLVRTARAPTTWCRTRWSARGDAFRCGSGAARRAWMFGIMHNLFIDRLRGQRSSPEDRRRRRTCPRCRPREPRRPARLRDLERACSGCRRAARGAAAGRCRGDELSRDGGGARRADRHRDVAPVACARALARRARGARPAGRACSG